jgi:hypothetical protein
MSAVLDRGGGLERGGLRLVGQGRISVRQVRRLDYVHDRSLRRAGEWNAVPANGMMTITTCLRMVPLSAEFSRPTLRRSGNRAPREPQSHTRR